MTSLENNPWVTGKGDKGEQRKKLPDEWLEDIMRLFLHARRENRSSGGGDFATDWCQPAQWCAQWEATNRKKYGDVAKTFQAFNRVCKALRTARTIRAVRGWCFDPKRSEIKDFGLQELTDVLAEMDRMQGKSNPPVVSSEGQHTSIPFAGDIAKTLPGGPGEEDPGSSEEILDEEFVDSRQSPLTKKAKELADASRRIISVYSESLASQFEAEVATRPLDGRCLVLVEAPTSAVAHMHDLLKKVAQHAPPDYDLWVPLGARWGMIDPVTNAIRKHLGRTQIFVWTASGGSQTERVRSTMGLWSPGPSRATQRCHPTHHGLGGPACVL